MSFVSVSHSFRWWSDDRVPAVVPAENTPCSAALVRQRLLQDSLDPMLPPTREVCYRVKETPKVRNQVPNRPENTVQTLPFLEIFR